MHWQRLGIIIAASVGILATFLPWINAPIVGSINGTVGDGWITLILFAISLVIGILGNRKIPLSLGSLIATLISSGLAAIIGVWKIFSLNQIVSDIAQDNVITRALTSTISAGIGLYLVIIAGIAIIIIGLMAKPAKPETEQKPLSKQDLVTIAAIICIGIGILVSVFVLFPWVPKQIYNSFINPFLSTTLNTNINSTVGDSSSTDAKEESTSYFKIGDPLSNDTFSITVLDGGLCDKPLNQFLDAEEGKKLVWVQIGLINISGKDVEFSPYLLFRLIDDNNISYDPTFRECKEPSLLDAKTLIPQITTKAFLTFQIGKDATAKILRFGSTTIHLER